MLFLSMILPAVGAAVVFASRPKNRRVCHAITMLFTLAASVCVAVCLMNPAAQRVTLMELSWIQTITIGLDGLGRVFAGMVAILWPLSTLYAFEYMEHEGGDNHFFGFYLLSYSVTLGVAFSRNLLTLYIFYELLSLSTLFLVMHGMKAKAVHAGRKYVYYMLGGAALAFLALVTVIHYTGSGNFVFGGIGSLSGAPVNLILIMFVLAFLGFGVKAAVFPFHAWLPTAGVAPTPVTALLHAVAVVKAGVFAVIRMSYYVFDTDMIRGTWAHSVCLILAMVSILYGSGMAVREPHLKRRLAYSTMSNLSYVLLGAMLLTPAGLKGGLMHMVYHALMKITLFSCVGAVMVKTGRSYVQEIRGMGKKMPFVMGVFMFAGAALVGIPPLVGFQSKWTLAEAALEAGPLGIAAVCVLLISAVLTAIYLLVPAFSFFFLPLDESGLEDRSYDPGWQMKAPLLILCVLMAVLVFASKPLTALLGQVAQGLL